MSFRTTATQAQLGEGEQPASRAMNVDATRDEVTAMCAKHKATISTIEELLSGGTRVVMMNGTDAATVRKAFGKKILAGEVTRARWGATS